jgi:chorismate mutase/prephenate dehydratase
MGPEGTFSHAAARSFFGLAATYTETTTIEGVFDAVARREAKHGVVPIENSSEGSVDHALDALVDGELLIRAELELEVAQCLLTRAGGLASVERVYSHPQALGQCRVWLAKNLAGAQLVQSPSTAAAVREAVADPRAAAVASRLASDLYGVPVLRERIQDHAENVFLADLEGHRHDENVARAAARLADKCPMVKHLGSYPRYVRPAPPVAAVR